MPDDDAYKSKPSMTQVLIDNYREFRQEGLKLVHSVFNDIAFSVALLGAIFTGGVITNEPKLLLLLPFLIGGIAMYEVQKLRVSNLITCYMIYLEKEINRDYLKPVMIWNSEFIRRNVSAGRQSKWGQALLFFATVVIVILYGSICYWVVSQNTVFFNQNFFRLATYISGCVLVLVFNILGILGSLFVTKRYSPEYIESLVKLREIEYAGKVRGKNLDKLSKEQRMIITSHGAAAVLAMAAYKKISRPKKTLVLKTIVEMFFFGVLPDIPLTLLVLQGRFNPSIHYHHKWITHTPIFWLAVSLLVAKVFSKRVGLSLLSSTWLHLGMDWYGGADGIAFLYPFTDCQFGIVLSNVNGPKGLGIYIGNPFFLFLEILIQGTFLGIFLSILKKAVFRKENL